MEKFIIIGDTLKEFDPPEEYGFLPYVYLHFEAEVLNGCDYCFGNIPVLQRLLGCHLFPCEVLLQNGETYDALVIPAFTDHRVKALVCLCTDLEGIRHAMFNYFRGAYIDTCIEEGRKKILFEKYPEIFKIIREYNLEH